MIETRLTRAFGLQYPVASAPMAGASGGALAAAVSRAGGLGLIGGGYCDADWIEAEFAAAGNDAVGCGLITWRLAEQPEVLDVVLGHAPRAVFLSFGDPAPFAGAIADAGTSLICQVQTLADAKKAVAAGAAVIVAQGSEAGGHGARRATMTLVPEVADYLRSDAPQVLLLAAGGIVDGRGLAAALMLGADGVLMGTRFWAAEEALVAGGLVEAALAADGDATLRTKTVDVARALVWPEQFDIRVMRNGFTDRWGADLDGLAKDAAARQAWADAMVRGDASVGTPIVGEGIGLVRKKMPAAQILDEISGEAEALLAGGWRQGS
ncbi:MAG: NAD(P)H-dependent flavin oxidoreductase [Paracoccaceae bacterium]